MVKYLGILPNLSWFSQVSVNSGIGINQSLNCDCHAVTLAMNRHLRRLISICAVGSLAFTLPLPFSESLVLWVLLPYFLGLTPGSRHAPCFTSGLFINRILLVFSSMPRAVIPSACLIAHLLCVCCCFRWLQLYRHLRVLQAVPSQSRTPEICFMNWDWHFCNFWENSRLKTF